MPACCQVFGYARREGTDGHAYGSAVYKQEDSYRIGGVKDAINFCPWCGIRFTDLPERSRIDHYRSQEYDPIQYLIAEMHVRGWTQSGLAKEFGSQSKASEVLLRKRRLSVAMIRRLVFDRGLDPQLLLGEIDLNK